jgi:hypothetical protein
VRLTHPHRPNEPCLLTDVVPQWRAATLWDDAYLRAALGGETVYAGGYPFTLTDYLRYSDAVSRDDAPLYLCAPTHAPTHARTHAHARC